MSPGRTRFAWIAALAVVAAVRTAQAQEPTAAAGSVEAQIDAIREHVLYVRYADAAAAVDALLARTDLTALQRNAGLEMRAMILVARRRLPEARLVLAELYGRDPEHRIQDPDTGPEVREEFERARGAHPPPITVALSDATPDTLDERRAPEIQVEITAGASAVHELHLSHRSDPAGAFERTIMQLDASDESARARVPLRDGDDAYTLEYHVEAVAPSGTPIGRLGTPSEPLSLAIPERAAVATVDPLAIAPPPGGRDDGEPSGSVLETWWFWTIVGVVLAGGVGVGIGVAASDGGAPGPGSLGEDRL